MRLAFVGKGGSGKTTLSSLLVRYLAGAGLPVIAIDADINQHLAEALGAAGQPQAMGAHLTEIKEYLRGDNPRITSAAAMVKTTPPGRGSRLLRFGGPDPVHGLSVAAPCGARLMATGPFAEDDIGVACYHSKTGAVELYLNHLLDSPGEYVVVDCTAGAESFASGLFTRFDLTFLVAEPTRKGVGVYRQWAGYAADYDVPLAVIGNKVQDADDVAFLRAHAGGGPAGLRRACSRGAGDGTGTPVPPRRPRPAHPSDARLLAARRGRPAPGLGQAHPPGRRISPPQRPGLGELSHRRGPGQPGGPRFRHGPAGAGRGRHLTARRTCGGGGGVGGGGGWGGWQPGTRPLQWPWRSALQPGGSPGSEAGDVLHGGGRVARPLGHRQMCRIPVWARRR